MVSKQILLNTEVHITLRLKFTQKSIHDHNYQLERKTTCLQPQKITPVQIWKVHLYTLESVKGGTNRKFIPLLLL